jgi:MFS transporter, MHS family, proline/betaine transporter
MAIKENFKRNIIASIIGNILELYDFTVFAFFAPIISQLFFPKQNQMAALIATFGVFAVGYLMRPIGGIIFGHIGDRTGRKPALLISIITMSLATVLIGCLPTYAEIGITATLLLIFLRLLQGLAAGGELAGSIVYTLEQAPINRRSFYTSWTTASVIAGVLLGSLVGAIVKSSIATTALQNWGWRIPFWSGIILGLVGLWIRIYLQESPSFIKIAIAKQIQKLPILTAIKNGWGKILQAMGLNIVIAASFYILFVWLPTYIEIILQRQTANSLLTNTIALTTLMLLIPVMGFLADFVDRKKLTLAALILLIILIYPGFLLMIHGPSWSIILLQIIFAFCLAPLEAVMPRAMGELFPTAIRYSSLAIGLNFTTAFFSGTAPLISTFLIQQTHNFEAPAFYLLIIASLSLPAYLFIGRKS